MPAADPLWLHSITTNECIRLRNATDILKCLWFLYSYSFPLQRFSLSPSLFSLSERTDLCVCFGAQLHQTKFPPFPISSLPFILCTNHVLCALGPEENSCPFRGRKDEVHKWTLWPPCHVCKWSSLARKEKMLSGAERQRDLEQWYTVLHIWELIHSLVLQAERVCN